MDPQLQGYRESAGVLEATTAGSPSALHTMHVSYYGVICPDVLRHQELKIERGRTLRLDVDCLHGQQHFSAHAHDSMCTETCQR